MNTFQNSHLAAFFLDVALKSVVVLVLAVAVCIAWRRAAAATRYLIWFLGLASLPLLPPLASMLPSWHSPLWSVSSDLVSGNQVSLTLELAPPPAHAISGNETGPVHADAANGYGHQNGRSPWFAAHFSRNWLPLGFAVWCTGVALALAYLASGNYLDYLRSMYGGKIYTPSTNDLQQCFNDYCADARKRSENHQLKPGEDVSIASGKLRVTGQVAVMGINALLARVIFDQNSNREFYIEESFPLDWMYPYLEPHGLIMKINRQPLDALSADIVQQDHDYWAKLIAPMIGDWLNDDTPVSDIAAYAEKVIGRQDLNGFTGDPEFVQNACAKQMFSKERSSIAGLYAWRAKHATDAAEKQRMNDAADFAFRQAWALCPYSLEAAHRYVDFLMSEKRVSDALLIAQTAANLHEASDQNGAQLRNLVKQLQHMQDGQK